MDYSFATCYDNGIHINCTNDASSKSKLTMRVFINAGEGDSRDGHACLVFKGSPNGRRKVVERLAYDSRVPMNFQKNTWVSTTATMQLAEEFVQRVKDKPNG